MHSSDPFLLPQFTKETKQGTLSEYRPVLKTIECLLQTEQLKHLILHGGFYGPQAGAYTCLETLTKLRVLDIEVKPPAAKSIQHMDSLPSVKTLTMEWVPDPNVDLIGGDPYEALTKFVNVRKATLVNLPFKSNYSWSCLAKLKSLRNLSLRNFELDIFFDQHPTEVLETFPFPKLKTLRILEMGYLNEATAVWLSRFENLREIDLGFNTMDAESDVGLQHLLRLADIPRLSHIHVHIALYRDPDGFVFSVDNAADAIFTRLNDENSQSIHEGSDIQLTIEVQNMFGESDSYVYKYLIERERDTV